MRGTATLAALVPLLGCNPSSDPSPSPPPLYGPTAPLVLSTASPSKDEDPSLVRSRDGRMVAVWFSERSGTPGIELATTDRSSGWSTATRISSPTSGGDFHPTLIQDEAGTFHLTWFRWNALYRGHIRYNSWAESSPPDPSRETQITNPANEDFDDWVPVIARGSDGTLLVYFVSDKRDPANPTHEIYATRRPPGAMAAWEPPVRLSINSPTEHDHLPVVARDGSVFIMVWVRADTSQYLPWNNPRSDLWIATSVDGLAWSTPSRITNDAGAVANIFAGLYADHGGQWWIVFTSTRLGSVPRVFEIPLANAGGYPAGLVELSALSPGGYSYRVVPAPVAGLFLGAWVQGQGNALDVYYRFFQK